MCDCTLMMSFLLQGDWPMHWSWALLPCTSTSPYCYSWKVAFSSDLCSLLVVLWCGKSLISQIVMADLFQEKRNNWKVYKIWELSLLKCSDEIFVSLVSVFHSNRVVACYDDVKKGACRRKDCKFFHPPNHLKVMTYVKIAITNMYIWNGNWL